MLHLALSDSDSSRSIVGRYTRRVPMHMWVITSCSAVCTILPDWPAPGCVTGRRDLETLEHMSLSSKERSEELAGRQLERCDQAVLHLLQHGPAPTTTPPSDTVRPRHRRPCLHPTAAPPPPLPLYMNASAPSRELCNPFSRCCNLPLSRLSPKEVLPMTAQHENHDQ